jgi:glutamine amidotransferase
MCRLLGVVASEATDHRFPLELAPRSLAAVAHEHPHGWGVAVHVGRGAWHIHKGTECAQGDARFEATAARVEGDVLVAHVRKKTVGPTALENTHPFVRGRWVFAHNGTIDDLEFLRRRSSRARLAEAEGSTDSEVLFAYLLTAIDLGGGDVDRALCDATAALAARAGHGSANFLLSDGRALWAHRLGRSLHVLDRDGAAAPAGTRRRPAVLVASERVTDEPFRELEDGALVRVDRGARPRVTVLRAARRDAGAPRRAASR